METTETSPQRSHALRSLIVPMLLVLGVFLVFHQALGFDFVDWDDDINIINNPQYHALTGANLAPFWKHSFYNQYMPVTWSVWAILAEWGRLPQAITRIGGVSSAISAVPFHLLALGCHLINVVLVWQVVRRLVKPTYAWAAAAGALLFGIHPVQTESAVWVNGGNITLAYTFGLGALLSYIHAAQTRKSGFVILSTLLFVLGLLSKPTVVSVVLAVIVVELCFLRRPVRTWIPIIALWVGLALASTLFNYASSPVSQTVKVPLYQRPFVAGDALAFYLAKLLIPTPSTIIYARTPATVMKQSWGYWTWLFPVAVGFLVWRLRRPELTGAYLLFIAALLPTLGLITFYFQEHSTVADRYMYFAMLGPALGFAWGIDRLAARQPPAAILSVALLGIIWAILSFQETQHWRNSLTLYENAVRIQPRSPSAQYNLGSVYQIEKRYDDALKSYTAAIRLYPRYAQAYTNAGTVLEKQNNPGGAARLYAKALEIAPNQFQANYLLGMYCIQHGDRDQAIAHWQRALAVRPDDIQTQFGLGLALVESGKREQGLQLLQTLLKKHPELNEVRNRITQIQLAKP